MKSPHPLLNLRSGGVLIPAVAAFALFAGVGFQLMFPAVTTLPAASDLAARRVREPAAPQPGTYKFILQQPIFAPDRAPDKELAAEGAMFGYSVLGIAVAGTNATALVRTPSGTIERVGPGQDVDGWKFIAADPHQLTLGRGDERRVLTVPQPQAASVVPAKAADSGGGDDTNNEQSDDTTDSDQSSDDQNNGSSP
ncbi:MAG TPA: hypothetical protein VK759_06960 [Rhizomicrobium sp.]|nr:hypothetical protein [Rhizomicrobium sp.]